MSVERRYLTYSTRVFLPHPESHVTLEVTLRVPEDVATRAARVAYARALLDIAAAIAEDSRA